MGPADPNEDSFLNLSKYNENSAGETSFVSESKLVSDSRLVPSDSALKNSYSFLNNDNNGN